MYTRKKRFDWFSFIVWTIFGISIVAIIGGLFLLGISLETVSKHPEAIGEFFGKISNGFKEVQK